MTKKLTIRDEVYAKLVSIKGKDESFSELFERLMEGQSLSEILKALRGRVDLDKDGRRKLLTEVDRRREELHV